MNTKEMTATMGADEFYPTPPSVARRMLEGVDVLKVKTILEPSAGKGNLIKAFFNAYDEQIDSFYKKNNWRGYRSYNSGEFKVDCVEIDPYLRQILKYEFEGRRGEMKDELYELRQKSYKENLTDEENNRYKFLEKEIEYLDRVDFHIVHDDFLTYRPYRHYDLILMNPPFSDGDKHLLKAIEIAEITGSNIVCLLNAETIRNPYSKSRIVLQNKLREYNATIEFIEDAFADAERAASVDVAVVKVIVPEPKYESSDIWDRMEKAEKVREIPDEEIHSLVVGDYIEQAIQMYNAEINATMEFVKQYKALVPYIPRCIGGEDKFDKSPIIQIKLDGGSDYDGFNLEKYIRIVRHKYWSALLSNKKFVGRLTSELQKKYQSEIDKLSDYEFSAFNIKQMLIEMNGSMIQGIEKAIMDLFEKLTQEHSYYPECTKTIHYYNGWKTNKAHKIGNKCIIPTWGMFSRWGSDKTFCKSTAYSVISDIEKALNYLNDGRITDDVDLNCSLTIADTNGKTRGIYCKYFTVDMFKKGTTHIKFHPEAMPIIDRLNIYASQRKSWLPPRYGKTTYKDMTDEEKAVVDDFNGDGEKGSGEQKYGEILVGSGFYLAEPTKSMPMLMAAS